MGFLALGVEWSYFHGRSCVLSPSWGGPVVLKEEKSLLELVAGQHDTAFSGSPEGSSM
jgi:hypothetical protein